MDDTTKKAVRDRLAQLPKVLQEAIASADVQKRLRELADTYKIHLDQGVRLENEVMLALLGFQPIADLEKNIKSEVGVSDEVAAALTADISRIIFQPIRQGLERELEHPDAKVKEESAIEATRAQILRDTETPESPEIKAPEVVPPTPLVTPPSAPPVLPATPPPPPPTEKAVRMPASGAYKPGEASAVRKDVHDDPYREPPA